MRITGGAFRSRSLRAPRGASTRPTSDRVREALFSILGARGSLAGARVLDLWAGTGALALEALSRGAASATLVDSSREAAEAIRANVEALGVADRARVIATTVARAVGAMEGQPFDLVFADPPYKDVALGVPSAIAELVHRGLVADGATVVVEHASRDAPPALPALAQEDTRRYGDTSITFYARPTP
jgi:16S rRNA (guanine966-N2)-methyltransferase